MILTECGMAGGDGNTVAFFSPGCRDKQWRKMCLFEELDQRRSTPHAFPKPFSLHLCWAVYCALIILLKTQMLNALGKNTTMAIIIFKEILSLSWTDMSWVAPSIWDFSHPRSSCNSVVSPCLHALMMKSWCQQLQRANQCYQMQQRWLGTHKRHQFCSKDMDWWKFDTRL